MQLNYLSEYAELYARDPRRAATEWFREAKYGLFLHYGLYSLLGRHEWVQLREKIPVAEMEKAAADFTAEAFDADAIADFAPACGMRYINLTTRHHDGFCLFRTAQTNFNSVQAPCGRDLVGELAQACASRGLGLCLYYSHGRDWRHPHAPNNDAWGGSARPEYDPPEPAYAYGAEHDLQKYLDFMSAQIRELLTQYGPIASIWLDGVAVPLSGDAGAFKCQELYDLIHSLQPQALVSYKQGVTGTEDYFAPEHRVPDAAEGNAKRGRIGQGGDAPIEVCTTMIRAELGDKGQSWGYLNDDMPHRHCTADEVWDKLAEARRSGANLLLNSGPRPDGSLDPDDRETLLAVGERIRKKGFPE